MVQIVLALLVLVCLVDLVRLASSMGLRGPDSSGPSGSSLFG